MIPLSLGEIAEVVGGAVHDASADLIVSAPATLDSREVEPGGLFVALEGEHVDGHDFAAGAVERGGAAVMASRAVGVPAVVVPDVQRALGQVARHVVEQLDATVIAITGSQGKTSVKDLLAHLLSQAGPTVATRGNYNNELGVPVTVLRAEADTRFLVVEMGARGVGHIAQLCEIAPPDVSVVLNVGSAHVGEFGSVDNIALAKGELVEALRAGGVAVLNRDDPRVDAMAARAAEGVRIVGFGTTATAQSDLTLTAVELDEAGEPDVTLKHAGTSWTTHVPLVGSHHGINLAAAEAVRVALELPQRPLDDYIAASPMRMQRHLRSDGVVIIDDSYNANPESVSAALQALAGVNAQRRIAVLGEMLELGAEAHARHVEVGGVAADLGIDRVIAIGAGAQGVAEGAGEVGERADDVDVAIATLLESLIPGDVVLVKASRGARLERVTHALLDQ